MCLTELKRRLFINRVFAFNLVDRDSWVESQAMLLPSGSRILDVGAGSCPYRYLFDHCEYLTQDVAQLQGAQLRNGGYGHIDYIGDASDIPAPDAEFDAILCTEMLEHHPEPIEVVRELARLLKPGGVLLLTAPLGSGIHQEPYHYYGGYTPYWYERFLTKAGFEKLDITSNGKFFRFFGQESLRFVRLSAPWRVSGSLLGRIVWSPFWLLLAPVLSIGMPVLGLLLDPWDREGRFTVGYHVRANRKRSDR